MPRRIYAERKEGVRDNVSQREGPSVHNSFNYSSAHEVARTLLISNAFPTGKMALTVSTRLCLDEERELDVNVFIFFKSSWSASMPGARCGCAGWSRSGWLCLWPDGSCEERSGHCGSFSKRLPSPVTRPCVCLTGWEQRWRAWCSRSVVLSSDEELVPVTAGTAPQWATFLFSSPVWKNSATEINTSALSLVLAERGVNATVSCAFHAVIKILAVSLCCWSFLRCCWWKATGREILKGRKNVSQSLGSNMLPMKKLQIQSYSSSQKEDMDDVWSLSV